ncbi:MAG TPA: saccharopine dehydrogenase NADP-binding domain-containing protein [Kofleriaceae bacterium]|nr:saccharopine dehydrogenase NADP-binding domain-containing protein [Kofleriaceae bacterium]
MRSPSEAAPIAVVGATGVVGHTLCAELVRMGAAFTVIGRRAGAIAELADQVGAAARHVAEAGDAAALARAVAGARVVVNAAGPLRDTAAPVLEAALAAGAHYVDVGGEQAVLHAIHEDHDAAARRAGRIALPGAGVDCALGDLAAAWAAAHLVGAADPGDCVRGEPAPRLAEDRPLDDIAVSYVVDGLVLSAGSQRALFGALGSRSVIWRRDRWEPGPAGDHRRINAGPALGGERDAQAFAAGDAITIPRHVAAHRIASYLSATRHVGAGAALRLVSRVLPLVPRRAGALLAPYAQPDADYGHTRFAVVAQARRGFSAAQITVHGHDLYRTTAVIAAWTACRLAERGTGPIGMRAPGELFRAEPALRAIASAADLTIEPSFG